MRETLPGSLLCASDIYRTKHTIIVTICYNKNGRNHLCIMGLQVLFGKDHSKTHGRSHSAGIRYFKK